MPEYLDINGAKIEKAYFEENVREARNHHWEKESILGAAGIRIA